MPTPSKGYFLKDGSRVPGTTTIIQRFKESGALMQWAFRQGQSGAPSLYSEAEKAAEIGTAAHSMVEQAVKGEEVTCPIADSEMAAKAWSSFEAYKRWAENFAVKIVAQEIQLVSEQYRYGGTPDAIGLIGNQLALLDWKTSNGIYTDYLVQLAAYKNLWEENYPDRPLTGGFHLLRFAKEHGDFGHHYFANLDNAWRQFVLFREAYEIDKELKKRAA